MRPFEPQVEARADQVRVDLPFGVPRPGFGWNTSEIRVIQQIRRAADQPDFFVGLDPAHPVHEFVHSIIWKRGGALLDRLPVRRAEEIASEPHLRRRRSRRLDQRIDELLLRRFDVRLVEHHVVDPAVTLHEPRGGRVRDDERLAVARPDQHHRARRIGEIHVPLQRSRIDDAGQVGEILARAQHQRVESRFVHQRIEARDVRDAFFQCFPCAHVTQA